ncbi:MULTISPECIES: DinB family protein [Bacillus]|nr:MULTISPECIES: DinB family protein [Bacillus]MBP1083923.1 putative damage-inducible protein DinB [Bacillus capparidis]MED1098401.1 DinB family protein [Bacillus capparidis]
MILDLKGTPLMEKNVGMLYAMVENNYRRLKSIVNGMTQSELDFKGTNGELNSTAQLLKHLAYVDVKWVYRIQGETLLDHLEKKYGPEVDDNGRLPSIEGVPLSSLLEDYDFVFRQFEQACQQIKDADLETRVQYADGATIKWGIWHMADHNRYHQAHINQLRKWYKESS